jgi:hypothetical protein
VIEECDWTTLKEKSLRRNASSRTTKAPVVSAASV